MEGIWKRAFGKGLLEEGKFLEGNWHAPILDGRKKLHYSKFNLQYASKFLGTEVEKSAENFLHYKNGKTLMEEKRNYIQTFYRHQINFYSNSVLVPHL